MRRLLAGAFVLAALPAFAQAPTVTISGDGAATVVSVGTQGPPGPSGGPITAPILGPAYDDCATPPFSFVGDTTTGRCTSAAGVVHLRSAGTNVFSVSGSAITGTVPFLAPDGSGAAPTYSFANFPTMGMFANAAGQLSFGSNGYNNLTLYGWTQLSYFGDAFTLGASSDVLLARDAAFSLGLRYTTNPQRLSVYNKYTDASNYERLGLSWASDVASIFTESAGSGAARKLRIGTFGAADLQFLANNNVRWEIPTASGNLQPGVDDGYSVGAAGKAAQFLAARRGIISSKTKTLTEGSATNIDQFQVADNSFADAVLDYAAFCSDGTDHLLRRGQVYFAAVAEGTTVSCPTPTEVGTPLAAPTPGAPSFTQFVWGCTAGANTATVTLQATCSLTQTTLALYYRPNVMQSASINITPQ